jgi:hypothetical protein
MHLLQLFRIGCRIAFAGLTLWLGNGSTMQAVVKQFFNEKEVTSTLVMDALYSGCKQIDEDTRAYLQVCRWIWKSANGRVDWGTGQDAAGLEGNQTSSSKGKMHPAAQQHRPTA